MSSLIHNTIDSCKKSLRYRFAVELQSTMLLLNKSQYFVITLTTTLNTTLNTTLRSMCRTSVKLNSKSTNALLETYIRSWQNETSNSEYINEERVS